MSAPGTAAWLRAMAKEHEDLSEGLARAANRIDRLTAELARAKTGVDPRFQPLPSMVPGSAPSFHADPNVAPGSPKYRVKLPENGDLRDQVAEWLEGSENLGLGLLDSKILCLDGEPGEADLLVEAIKPCQGDAGNVLLMGPTQMLRLSGCMVSAVTANSTGETEELELVAQNAEEPDA